MTTDGRTPITGSRDAIASKNRTDINLEFIVMKLYVSKETLQCINMDIYIAFGAFSHYVSV